MFYLYTYALERRHVDSANLSVQDSHAILSVRLTARPYLIPTTARNKFTRFSLTEESTGDILRVPVDKENKLPESLPLSEGGSVKLCTGDSRANPGPKHIKVIHESRDMRVRSWRAEAKRERERARVCGEADLASCTYRREKESEPSATSASVSGGGAREGRQSTRALARRGQRARARQGCTYLPYSRALYTRQPVLARVSRR